MKLVEVAPPDPPSDVPEEVRPFNPLPGIVIAVAVVAIVYWIARHFF